MKNIFHWLLPFYFVRTSSCPPSSLPPFLLPPLSFFVLYLLTCSCLDMAVTRCGFFPYGDIPGLEGEYPIPFLLSVFSFLHVWGLDSIWVVWLSGMGCLCSTTVDLSFCFFVLIMFLPLLVFLLCVFYL